jgi:FkbM family methyltransferase
MIPPRLRRLAPRPLVRLLNFFRPAHRRLAEIRYRENAARERLRQRHVARNADAAPGEVVLRDNLRLRVHPDSVEPFEHFCFRSPLMVDELDAFLEVTRGRHRLLDVGALHGIFSLVFAATRPDPAVVAVDASPLAFARLLYNIHKNEGRGSVVACENALSDADGMLRMHYEWEHAVAAPAAAPGARSLEVPKTTGDALCGRLGFAPDTIKIDVEGHEVKVLRGLARIIREQRPLLFMEIHPALIASEGETGADLLPLFESLGYRARDLSRGPLPLGRLFAEGDRVVLSSQPIG